MYKQITLICEGDFNHDKLKDMVVYEIYNLEKHYIVDVTSFFQKKYSIPPKIDQLAKKTIRFEFNNEIEYNRWMEIQISIKEITCTLIDEARQKNNPYPKIHIGTGKVTRLNTPVKDYLNIETLMNGIDHFFKTGDLILKKLVKLKKKNRGCF